MSTKEEDVRAQERDMRQREMELRTQNNPKAQKQVDAIAQEKNKELKKQGNERA